jgi:hypothetical protein
MVNGKAKGGFQERIIATELSLWLSQGKDKNMLWRSASSGGRSTQHAKNGEMIGNQAGDISAIAEGGYKLINRFIIEVKFYKDLEIQNLIYITNTGIPNFWEKLTFDCKRFKKYPMLIAKQNHQPELVCLDKDGAKLLDISLTSEIWRAYIPYLGMYVCFLKDFLNTASTGRL